MPVFGRRSRSVEVNQCLLGAARPEQLQCDFAGKPRVRQVTALISVDEGIGIAFGFSDVAQRKREAAHREVITASSNRSAFILGQVLLTSLQQQPAQRCRPFRPRAISRLMIKPSYIP